MAELKTQKTGASVEDFLAAVDEPRQAECRVVADIMSRATGAPPKMWGASIVGFGDYDYKYASGRAANWMLTGFSPRKTSLTLYIMSGFSAYDDIMARLGKHGTGKSCLYIKKLDDIDLEVLEELVRASVAHMQATHVGTAE
jgi:hypothetical protein